MVTLADLIEALQNLATGADVTSPTEMAAIWQSLGAGRLALREELPQTMRVIHLDGNYVNLWGFGDHIYLGLALVGFPDSTPVLYLMSPGGQFETLLTLGQVKTITGNPNVVEIVAVLEAPDGTVFCTTHPNPVHILRKRPTDTQFTSVYNDATMSTGYSMAIDELGYIFATMRGPAAIGGPHRSVIRSIDGGAIWATMWTDANDWLFTVEAIAGLVIAGGRDIIANSRDRGVTWATTVVAGDVRGIKTLEGRQTAGLIEAKIVALVVDYYGTYHISLDGGVTWTEPANKMPIGLAQTPNTCCIAPDGELFAIPNHLVKFVRTRTLSKWSSSGRIPIGAVARSIYVTDTHIYIGTLVGATNPYYSLSDNGMVWIIPRSTLNWMDNYWPVGLWDSQIVEDTGLNTDYVQTLEVDKKTFYLLSDQSATVGAGNEGLFIQAWDEVNGGYETIDSISVVADVLTSYQTRYGARRMRLSFFPTAQASVDAWAVIE